MKLDNRPILLAALVVALGAPSLLSACNMQCPQVRRDYEQSLERETRLSQELEEGDEPAQLGLTLKTDLLGDVANTALQSAIEGGLDTLAAIDVGGGQSVDVQTRGDVAELSVEASDACEHCFRIGGDLGGAVDLDIPAVGERSADLDGSLSLVAPLVFEQNDDGDTSLALDLPEAARIGQSSLDANLSGLRDSWARTLQSELSDRLLDELTDELEPVELVSFDHPDFGIPGLEVFPVELATDTASEAVFAGFSTNIEALETEAPIDPVTELEDDQNLALTFNPNLVAHGVSLMMQKDVVSRTYTADGRPLRDGPSRVAIDGFSFSKGRVGELPMQLDFRVFHLGEDEEAEEDDTQMCYWFEGEANGRIALSADELEVSLTEVDIVDASLPTVATEATRWTQAEFLDGGKRLVRASLDEDNLQIPGGQLAFAGLSVELLENQVVLAGASEVR